MRVANACWPRNGRRDSPPSEENQSSRLSLGTPCILLTPSPMKLLLPILAVAGVLLGGCALPRTFARQKGDEIIVAGQRFHTGTRVITWMDPGGYDAYRVERRFVPFAESGWTPTIAALPKFGSPNRYGLRQKTLSPEEIELRRGGGWDLPALQRVVDQFVLHYDVAGVSKQCFNILHDHRDLSVHL